MRVDLTLKSDTKYKTLPCPHPSPPVCCFCLFMIINNNEGRRNSDSPEIKQYFLPLDSADSGFNSTDLCSEATEMEYLRKVLFEYMMGRETKVCSSHQPTHIQPPLLKCFITMTDTKKLDISKCVSRCLSLTRSMNILCFDWNMSTLKGFSNVMS